ncbi:MAG: phage portal protein [Eubacteriales bacterium]
MQKRNLLQKIFGSKPKGKQSSTFKLINSSTSKHYAWSGGLMDSDIVRSCIRPKASAVGKLTAKHLVGEGENMKINPKPAIKSLLERPNEFESMQDFLMKMVWQREIFNNAFAYVKRDGFGNIEGIYALNYTSTDLFKVDGEVYVLFKFRAGEMAAVPYDQIIHLRKDYSTNDFYGSDGVGTLTPVLEVTGATDKSIVNAVNNSTIIRWLLKYGTSLRDDTLKEKAKAFVETFMNIEDGVGAAAVGAEVDAQQVEPKDYVPNAAVMDRAKERLYDYFGVNKNIIQNSFTENQWQAFYEQEIEPVSKQLSDAFTYVFFTDRERGLGHRIVFEASALNFANMSTKLKMAQVVDRGSMTPNEWRTIMNLAAIKGGDEPIRRKDTGLVSEEVDKVDDKETE